MNRPDTRDAALQFPGPLTANNSQVNFELDEGRTTPGGEPPRADLASISPGFFRVMAIPVVQGRDISERDANGAPQVALVSQSAARQYWPGQDPIGHRILLGPRDDPKSGFTIVGVVGDIRRRSPAHPPAPTLYVSYHQFTIPYMTLLARAPGGSDVLSAAVRSEVRAIDPLLPLGEVRPLSEMQDHSIGQTRFRTLLLSAFAGVVLLLAAGGIYGLMSYSTAQRTREIGIRLSLGAKPADVLRLVGRRGLGLTLAGLGAGVAGALALSRIFRGLLFDTSATDPLIYAGIAVLLAPVAAVACFIPAYRATRVDPGIVLRGD